MRMSENYSNNNTKNWKNNNSYPSLTSRPTDGVKNWTGHVCILFFSSLFFRLWTQSQLRRTLPLSSPCPLTYWLTYLKRKNRKWWNIESYNKSVCLPQSAALSMSSAHSYFLSYSLIHVVRFEGQGINMYRVSAVQKMASLKRRQLWSKRKRKRRKGFRKLGADFPAACSFPEKSFL